MFIEYKNIIELLSISKVKLPKEPEQEDIVKFVPRKYIDFTHPQGATFDNVGNEVCMLLHLNDYKEGKTTTHITYFVGHCIDKITNKKVNVMWFGQAYMRPILYRMSGHPIHVCGTLHYDEKFRTFSLQNPKITTESKNEALTILPVYTGIAEKDYDNFREVLTKCVNEYEFRDWIPEHIRKECNLMTLEEAYKEVHFPTNFKRLKRALTTLDFEKLLKFSIKLATQDNKNCSKTNFVPTDFRIIKEIAAKLPFELTNDQKQTINSILFNMKKGKCETALIQGDVGSGKTIVAIMIMAAMAKSHYQSVLVAPTSVLAEQHFQDIKELCEPFGLRIALLTSNVKASQRKKIIQDINNGSYDIIVGTHSVLNDSIEYNNLALIITDEEHKFGVSQREKLRNKTLGEVHSLSMSATPIPRTLATTFYGNSVNVYTIKEKPQGRLPVTTKIENDYENAFGFLDQEIKKGHQCYVVAPKIESGSGKQKNVLSVKQLTAMLEKYFAQHNSSVVVKSLTGKTKAEEKTAVLKDFCDNKIQILVSTTVIEVGVNVPNATVIAISNAEMFGLASLHQLRGRVGRSNLQSYCLLISDKQDNQRLKALVETNDGFEIAKQDLKQRGSGDLTGVAQSGFTEEIAIMLNNPKMFEFTQKYAKDLSRIPV